MAKGSNFDDLARDAVARIEKAREAGEQLTFLPDEPAPAASGDRAKRGKGKATSMLREFLAARGMRLAGRSGLALQRRERRHQK